MAQQERRHLQCYPATLGGSLDYWVSPASSGISQVSVSSTDQATVLGFPGLVPGTDRGQKQSLSQTPESSTRVLVGSYLR